MSQMRRRRDELIKRIKRGAALRAAAARREADLQRVLEGAHEVAPYYGEAEGASGLPMATQTRFHYRAPDRRPEGGSAQDELTPSGSDKTGGWMRWTPEDVMRIRAAAATRARGG